VIWRNSYQALDLGSIQAPNVIGETLSGDAFELTSPTLLLGAFDFRGASELGVWSRLCQSESFGISTTFAYFLSRRSREIIQLAKDMTSPSLHSATVLVWESQLWHEIIQPDRPERSFGCLIKDGVAEPILVGTPTEEAWDYFIEKLGARMKPC